MKWGTINLASVKDILMMKKQRQKKKFWLNVTMFLWYCLFRFGLLIFMYSTLAKKMHKHITLRNVRAK